MIKTAVIGYPISQSKSPLVHGYWFEKYGIQGRYEAIEVAPNDLETAITRLVEQGYAGFNVTVPHKTEVMTLCIEIDPLAQKIGAVNTVVIRDGKLFGSNTDAYGFSQNVKENTPNNWSFMDKNCLVIGAGGASKAIVYSLLQDGVSSIFITNRTRQKADALAALAPERISVVDWDMRSQACLNKNVIVNTSSLGMSGKPHLEIDISLADEGCLVSDIVYVPLMTDLLLQAKNLGMPVVTGIGMLLHQARPGFKKWNGVMPDVTPELEAVLL